MYYQVNMWQAATLFSYLLNSRIFENQLVYHIIVQNNNKSICDIIRMILNSFKKKS